MSLLRALSSNQADRIRRSQSVNARQFHLYCLHVSTGLQMSAISNTSNARISWISAVRLDRVLLASAVALAGILFWIAPRPGMVDLPQHAGQVAILQDLVAGTSSWSDLVRINYFTPYLLGPVLAFGFSFVMPLVAALKLVLMLAFYGYVAFGIKLREEFDADKRLDWLFVPGFFGFAYQWGFFTFLVATPIAFLFLIYAHRFAQSRSFSGGLRLFLAGVGLFFSHGLVFLFACAIGAAFIPFFCRTPRRIVAALAPYAAFGLLALAYYLALHHNDFLSPDGAALVRDGIAWDWFDQYGWHRSYEFLLYTVATTRQDWYFLLGVGFLLVAPWLIGSRLNWKNPASFVMMAAVLAVWFGSPSDALGTAALYQRFAIYLLPAYALVFRQVAPQVTAASSRPRPWFNRSFIVRAAVALFCCTYLSVLGIRAHRFALASEPFETVLAAAEPGQRALNIVIAPRSAALHNQFTYLHYPLWYQVDKDGFVDFNFAADLPQIVRFKPDRVPAVAHQTPLNSPQEFNWHAVQGRTYRYFFVQHIAPLPAGMFDNDECEVVPVKEVGEWSLFERRSCH